MKVIVITLSCENENEICDQLRGIAGESFNLIHDTCPLENPIVTQTEVNPEVITPEIEMPLASVPAELPLNIPAEEPQEIPPNAAQETDSLPVLKALDNVSILQLAIENSIPAEYSTDQVFNTLSVTIAPVAISESLVELTICGAKLRVNSDENMNVYLSIRFADGRVNSFVFAVKVDSEEKITFGTQSAEQLSL